MASLTIDDVLGPGGLLSRDMERYEHRPPQIEMARGVADALEEDRSLIVEAATGTGKTLAYLVPALLSGRRVVISTGTKALQEQLFHKDIPLLQENWPGTFEAAQLKGRRNYLCQLRFDQMLLNPRFRGPRDSQHWEAIQAWAFETETGDRAEISGLPDDFPTWADLSVSSEACLGKKCRHAESCFVNRAREEAREAQIIVVNHHLFFADLSLRRAGFGEILPEYDAVIFDEAHHLESIASGYFGLQISNWRIKDLVDDVRRALENEEITDGAVDDALDAVTIHGKSLFSLLAFGLYDGRYALDEVYKQSTQNDKIDEAHELLAESLTELERQLGRYAGFGDIPERLPERCAELKFEFEEVLDPTDERFIYFVELRDKSIFVQAAPIDLAELFRKKLFVDHDCLIFTSATLATGGNFDFFKQRLGIEMPGDDDEPPIEVEEMLLPAVFDYSEQCVLYVPRKMPGPKHPEFPSFVAQVVAYLVEITAGRAFVLFTSYYNLNRVYEILEEDFPFPMLKQGSSPRNELLERFRADPASVLFATSSFWEGVDVEGEALSMVIIDKLPFASPSDPLVRARIDLMESRGQNAFMEYSVPQAALTLKQGFGRLIRSRSDRGVVAVLDSRIAHKRYGRYFLETLPEAPRVWTAPGVKGWWYDKVGAPDDD